MCKLLDVLDQLESRTDFEINNKKRKLIKNYKDQEDVERHDRLRPSVTRHIK